MMNSFSRLSQLLALGLVLSLALNGFLLTRTGHRWFKHEHQPSHAFAGFEERMAARLGEDDSKRFKQALAPHKVELAARMQAAKLARDALHEAMAAEPFNRSAAEAALNNQQTAMAQFHAVLRPVFLDAAETLTPEGRLRLLDRHEFRK